MDATGVITMVVMLGIGLVLGFVLGRARAGAALAAARAERAASAQRADELAADRQSLANQFKVLADQTLTEQTRRAEQLADQRFTQTEALMTPVAAGLTALQARLGEVENQRVEMSTRLGEQVRMVQATGEQLRRETNALSTALRKPQVRGAWGELQLRRVVEIAGMVDRCDFFEQASDVTSAERRIRPDMKVMLGEGKFVYVDAKVPLAAFLDAQESSDEADRAANLRAFAANVQAHVDQLSGKNYWKANTGSPEFVVLFIPSEALAAAALEQRPELHEYAAGRNIIIATPTTLIGMLRAIAYGWKQAALADSAAEVFALGRELYDRLTTMGDNFNKLGRSLHGAVKDYNSTVGSLEGRVLVSARRFRDLQVTDDELRSAGWVETSVRPLAAPELIADARLGVASGPQAELAELTPGEPSVAELVEADLVETERHHDDELRGRLA